MSKIKPPIAYHAYQTLADKYAAMVPTKDYNAYYDRPAILSLIDDVHDQCIIDAGCGTGIYTEILLERKAIVTAIDVSDRMLYHAMLRNGDKATYHLHNLELPLNFLNDGESDGIVSALTVAYIQDLSALFKEFNRILKLGGWVVFSTEHPFYSYTYFGLDDYFETQEVKSVWKSFDENIEMPCYYHSLTCITDSLLENGFAIEKILEPKPTIDFKNTNPSGYAKRMKFPSFIHFKAIKKRSV